MEIMQFEEFKRLVSSRSTVNAGIIIPVYRRVLVDLLTPVNAYMRLRGKSRYSFLLESVEGGERFGRYSFLGRNPADVLRCRNHTVTFGGNGDKEDLSGDGIEQLREALSRYKPIVLPELPPFTGGSVGFLSYNAVKYFEKIDTARETSDGEVDDITFAFYPTIMAFDHFKHQAIIISNVFISEDEADGLSEKKLHTKYDSAISEIDDVISDLAGEALEKEGNGGIVSESESFDKAAFVSAVERAKSHIVAGDIFQVVLSRREMLEGHPESFEVYRALRTLNPSPYLFFIEMGDLCLAGSSPEMLVKVQDGNVQVRPIAGTRPRGATPEEDKALEKELRTDEKERAEHAMLVDLGRNDVGKVAEYGSVEVDELMAVERYSHVMHLVSRITGKLRNDCDSLDALIAAFPAGTVTGAPKRRAMEIIGELEPVERGVYAGAVGYIDYGGNLDTCIAIRTIVFRNGTAIIQAGAGIVNDSVPTLEYDETRSKARVLREAISMAAKGL